MQGVLCTWRAVGYLASMALVAERAPKIPVPEWHWAKGERLKVSCQEGEGKWRGMVRPGALEKPGAGPGTALPLSQGLWMCPQQNQSSMAQLREALGSCGVLSQSPSVLLSLSWLHRPCSVRTAQTELLLTALFYFILSCYY